MRLLTTAIAATRSECVTLHRLRIVYTSMRVTHTLTRVTHLARVRQSLALAALEAHMARVAECSSSLTPSLPACLPACLPEYSLDICSMATDTAAAPALLLPLPSPPPPPPLPVVGSLSEGTNTPFAQSQPQISSPIPAATTPMPRKMPKVDLAPSKRPRSRSSKASLVEQPAKRFAVRYNTIHVESAHAHAGCRARESSRYARD